ncbi:MAG TPA: hypothetical protein VGZ47_23865, partial [Gemmataceae bacterium]|nr:hypothetical protein [Gemmataceae bacterium]
RARSLFKSNGDAGMTLPLGHHLGDLKPQYFGPDPDFPLEKDLKAIQGENENKQPVSPPSKKLMDENEKWIESLRAKQREVKAREKSVENLLNEFNRLSDEAKLNSVAEFYLAPFYVDPERVLRPAEMLAQDKNAPKQTPETPQK